MTPKLTKQQRAALEWLAGPCDTHFALDTRVWNNLEDRGLVTYWRGRLIPTRKGRELVRELRKADKE